MQKLTGDYKQVQTTISGLMHSISQYQFYIFLKLHVTLLKFGQLKKRKLTFNCQKKMKKSIISETQIVNAIKEHESGKNTNDICRELGIHKATFYNWKKKYSGMDNQELKRLKELEEENRRLKHMYADLALDHKILKDVLSKKF